MAKAKVVKEEKKEVKKFVASPPVKSVYKPLPRFNGGCKNC